MAQYIKVNVKLSDRQLKQLKTVVKNKTRITLRMNLKMLDGNYLPQELLLIKRQKTKLRNEFDSSTSTGIKLFKAQFFEINQSEAFLGSLLSKLAGP